jgi:hypothetical protein
MCGELDEESEVSEHEEKHYARFLKHARQLLKDYDESAQDPPADLASYMERLFCDAINRSVRDGEQAGEANAYERLAVQPVVFARLAGLMAGHLSLGEDPLRKVIEALMLGYAEAEAIDQQQDHSHHHGDVVVHE